MKKSYLYAYAKNGELLWTTNYFVARRNGIRAVQIVVEEE